MEGTPEQGKSTRVPRRRFLQGAGAALAAIVLGKNAPAKAQQPNRVPSPLTLEEYSLVEAHVVRNAEGKITNLGPLTREEVATLSHHHPTVLEGGRSPHPEWCCGLADCRFAAVKEVNLSGRLHGFAVGINLVKGQPVFAFFKEPNLLHSDMPDMPEDLLAQPQACITANSSDGGGTYREELGNPFCLYYPQLG